MSVLDELPKQSCGRPTVISEDIYPKYAFTISFNCMSDDVERFIEQRFFPIIEYVLDIYADNWSLRWNTLNSLPKNVHFAYLDWITPKDVKFIEIKFDARYPERVYMLLCQPVFFMITKYIEINDFNPKIRLYIRDSGFIDVNYNMPRDEIYSNTVIANMNAHLYYNDNTAYMDYSTIAKFIYPFCTTEKETERWMKRWLDKAGRKAFQSPGLLSIY